MRTIPESFFSPAEKRGRVERIDYGGKYALVYLPQGKAENTLYLIHGGGGDQQSFFCPRFLNLLDNMIASGELAPLVVVSPTYYAPDETVKTPSSSGIAVEKFSRELRGQIIPAVENAFPETRRDRLHRGISGFSMGGVATWYAFLQALDLFSRFLPLSGDCWVMGEKGGGDRPRETAQALSDCVAAQGYTARDFRIHALTGTKDIAFPNLDPQMKAMESFPEVFRFGENTEYELLEDGVHDYETIFRYLFHALPAFFR